MTLFKTIAATAAALALPAAAQAAVTVNQYGTTALGAFSYTVSGHTITINETWADSNNVFLQFRGLDTSAYHVIVNVTNASGAGWTSVANELLDPGLDSLDPRPQPAFVPTGYSTSNNSDGLSFDQNGGQARTSSLFPTVVADELTDNRDYLDFLGAVADDGASFDLRYGLIDTGNNEPFLLSQRVNVRSIETGVPEPATWAMMIAGFGLVGGAMRRRAARMDALVA